MIGLHPVQHDERLAGIPDVDQRLLGAEAEASGLHQLHVEAALLDGVGEGVVDAFRPVAGSAGAHADGDARPRGQQLGQPGIANRVECALVTDAVSCARLPLVERVQFTLQRPLVHMAEDRVIEFHDRRKRALAEAGDGSQGRAAVGGGDRQLILSPRPRPETRSFIISFSNRSREPLVWQAVPRQTETVLRPCGSRLNSA